MWNYLSQEEDQRRKFRTIRVHRIWWGDMWKYPQESLFKLILTL
jgi:hypothetical protein